MLYIYNVPAFGSFKEFNSCIASSQSVFAAFMAGTKKLAGAAGMRFNAPRNSLSSCCIVCQAASSFALVEH